MKKVKLLFWIAGSWLTLCVWDLGAASGKQSWLHSGDSTVSEGQRLGGEDPPWVGTAGKTCWAPSSKLTQLLTQTPSDSKPRLSIFQEERPAFDIHDYGDRIVRALSGVGCRRTFAAIVHGLDNFEASKYLLASLQLVKHLHRHQRSTNNSTEITHIRPHLL